MLDAPVICARMHLILSRKRSVETSTELAPLEKLQRLVTLSEELDAWIDVVSRFVALVRSLSTGHRCRLTHSPPVRA